MKYLASVTLFIFAVAIGVTFLASSLLDRFGNVRKLTEVTRIHTEKENAEAGSKPVVQSINTQISTPKTTAESKSEATIGSRSVVAPVVTPPTVQNQEKNEVETDD